MKNYVVPAQAIKELNNGKTIKCDTSDGYSTIKKVSKGQYQFSIFENENNIPTIFKGDIKNVMKTLNRPDFKNGLYIE